MPTFGLRLRISLAALAATVCWSAIAGGGGLLAGKAAPAAEPIKIVLVGDSTVNDQGGWGTGFRASFGPPVQCVNLARNGRSSKSFRDEGAWAPVLAQKPAYVL